VKGEERTYGLVRGFMDTVTSLCVADCAVGACIEGLCCAVSVHCAFSLFACLLDDLGFENPKEMKEKENGYCIIIRYGRMAWGGDVYDLLNSEWGRITTSRYLAAHLNVP